MTISSFNASPLPLGKIFGNRKPLSTPPQSRSILSPLNSPPLNNNASSLPSKTKNVSVAVRMRPILDRTEKCYKIVHDHEAFDNTPRSSLSRNINHYLDEVSRLDINNKRIDPSHISKKIPRLHSLIVGENNQKVFDFDEVFSLEVCQREVYDQTVRDAISNNIFYGVNTTVIAYGQTASGKSYTMEGKSSTTEIQSPTSNNMNNRINKIQQQDSFDSSDSSNDKFDDSILPDDDDGIIVRSIHEIFRLKSLQQGQVRINMTQIEIYNDEIRDLLSKNDDKCDLEFRDYGDGVIVKDLNFIEVENLGEALQVVKAGKMKRTTGRTEMNAFSSRSHSILTCRVVIYPPKDDSQQLGATDKVVKAKLTFVDLAGLERLKQTKCEKIQKQEGLSINTDLFVLAKFISALVEKNQNH